VKEYLDAAAIRKYQPQMVDVFLVADKTKPICSRIFADENFKAKTLG
jgi:hypothetical protein